MATNPTQSIVSLLEDEWDEANTGGVRPVVGAVTEYKRVDLGILPSRSIILVHRPSEQPETAGIGSTHKNVVTELNVDIRTLKDEETFWKLKEEVVRILEAKIKSPPTGFDILDPNTGSRQDLSNKAFNLYRILIPVRLHQYAEAMNS